jgi:hypothetical protein
MAVEVPLACGFKDPENGTRKERKFLSRHLD